MRTTCNVARCLLLSILLALGIVACGGNGTTGTSGPQTIVVGATLPLTGPLAVVGVILKAGYQAAVNDANASGEVKINGTKAKINLVVLDNASDPNTASSQATTLFLKDNAVALLGPFTPQLVIPVSQVAERMKRPLITSVAPVEAWLSARPSGWQYSWDIFFDENQQTKLIFQTANLTTTNKRVALFTDTEQDGLVMGGLWEQNAPQFGYQIVYHAKFPVGTTNFSSQIAAAKAANADVLITQMIPPDAMALWKQMKSLGYHPKVAEAEKGSSTTTWPQSLGSVAEGALISNFWSKSLNYPGDSTLITKSQQAGFNATIETAGFIAGYTLSQILFDAINSTNSTDPAVLNTAIGKTDKTYPLGPIKFGSNHADAIPALLLQWQKGDTVQVYPPVSGITLEAPAKGLA
jgi:branched-chain amino acid transport system substrate-binding protein